MISHHLKIFISSTFLDMHKEREALLKKVFVKLKKEAKQRGVEITEIDLRWGITEAEANSGKTVKICLDEIERCKDSPIFFLGVHYIDMLGVAKNIRLMREKIDNNNLKFLN